MRSFLIHSIHFQDMVSLIQTSFFKSSEAKIESNSPLVLIPTFNLKKKHYFFHLKNLKHAKLKVPSEF